MELACILNDMLVYEALFEVATFDRCLPISSPLAKRIVTSSERRPAVIAALAAGPIPDT